MCIDIDNYEDFFLIFTLKAVLNNGYSLELHCKFAMSFYVHPQNLCEKR